MSKAKHVVLEGCDADTLPQTIREGIGSGKLVRVTIEEQPDPPRLMRFRGIGAYRQTSIEDAVARIRSLRDDWD